MRTRREEKAGLLSKSLLDGKHKVINLRPAGWQAGEDEGVGGLRGLFGEEIPSSSWEVSGRDGAYQIGLAI